MADLFQSGNIQENTDGGSLSMAAEKSIQFTKTRTVN